MCECPKIPFTLSAIQKSAPSDACGVYGFWYGRRCVYVGKTERQSLRRRLEQHWEGSHNRMLRLWLAARGSEMKVSLLAVHEVSKVAGLERYYIRRLQPVANRIRFV